MADESIVQKFAEGVALAEGYYVDGSRPNRNNNPGDLTQDITGRGVARDGMFVVYQTAEDGWEALRQQIRMALDNASHVYNSGMSIREFAEHYTTTDQLAWAETVASHLGVSLDTRLSDLTGVAVVAAASSGGLLIVFALIWFFGRKGR